MEKNLEQMGYLILTMDGAVISSGGDLENNEQVADIIAKSISMSKNLMTSDDHYQSMSIMYSNYHYSICMSNKKIHIAKIRHESLAIEIDEIRVISETNQ
ncbi:ragulator complex protein LAMTOR4 homolog [Daktulosphaira vitifoliae]|uniref:ragulator complex protein LAMTOR4 homolog n=1 Tax=Daktulosphaira vitifoliae TaxID=58002 RepID=UPI0021AA10AE|nr:ragulator complex protein LAMTOR4 homolog [Daktulosphaira vitifoliae]